MTDHISPRRLAAAVGVSQSSIKRWVDAGRIASTVTAGGHRRIPRTEAIRFVRDSGMTLVDPGALGMLGGGARDGAGREKDWTDELYQPLLEGQTGAAVGVIQAAWISGWDSARILDGAFRVAMERLGELWRHQGEEGVFLEHRATQIGLRILHELRSLQSRPPTSAPLALGGAPDGDPYLLPSLSVATVLESVGFSTSDLGPATPDSAFVSAIESLRPTLVWVSVTRARRPVDHRRSLQALAPVVERVGGTLVLGGQGSGGLSGDNGVVSFQSDSLVELAAFARGVLRSSRKRADHP